MNFSEMQLAGDRATVAEVATYNREIALEYRRAYQSIKLEIEKLYSKLAGLPEEEWIRYAYQRERLLGLQSRITEEYNRAALKAGKIQIGASRTSMANNYYRQQYAVDFATSAEMFTALPTKVIEISVKGTPEVWADIEKTALDNIETKFGPSGAYQPKSGTLTETLVKNRNLDVSKLKSSITRSIATGKDVKAAARDIRKIIETTTSNAERIFRTENHRNRSNADWANYQQFKNQGIDLWREIVSVFDDRTRAQSARVDGKIDKDGSGFLYPDGIYYQVPGATGVPAYDINDREKVVTVIPGLEAESQRRGRNPLTGKNEVFSYKDFPEWAKEHGLKKNKYGELMPV